MDHPDELVMAVERLATIQGRDEPRISVGALGDAGENCDD
jgi:hypothetical protein